MAARSARSGTGPDVRKPGPVPAFYAAFLVAAVLSLATLNPSAARAQPTTFRAGEFDPPRDAPDFRLRGSDGSELTLARYRGKVVILEFGFTSCPSVCPTTLALLARAYKDLGEDAARTQLVYVTVDPERDTAPRLHDYLARFEPAFIGGTGTEEELAAVRQSYGVQSAKTADAASYVHSSSVYLVDPDGKLRALMPFGQTSDDFVHDVRMLLGR